MTDVKIKQPSMQDRLLASFIMNDDTLTLEKAANAIRSYRQAAKKAQQERDAAYIEGKGGVIPGAVVFASLVSGNSMPCMSGGPRDRMTPYRRRQFDDATRALATAIRSQGHE